MTSKHQVNFELGEDIYREKQDKLWSSANIDGRSHVIGQLVDLNQLYYASVKQELVKHIR
eukprot:gene25004-32580_t